MDCPRWLGLLWVGPLLLMAGCSDDSTTTSEPGSTSASAANPVVVFDGSTCSYGGPDKVTGGGLTTVTLENSSDIDIDAGVFRVRNENTLQAAFDRLAPGTGSDILLAPPPGSVLEAWLQAHGEGIAQAVKGFEKEGGISPEKLRFLRTSGQ